MCWFYGKGCIVICPADVDHWVNYKEPRVPHPQQDDTSSKWGQGCENLAYKPNSSFSWTGDRFFLPLVAFRELLPDTGKAA